MNDDEDETVSDTLEIQPDILSLLKQLYEKPSDEASNSPPNGNDGPNSSISLGNLSSEARISLENRFIEMIHEHPCFYDPSNKNFAHNQVLTSIQH
jgi:hypothetical protein